MRARLILGLLFAFVIAFAGFALAHIFPPEPYGLADDWRVFFAAAQLAQHGGSPYDPAAIHAAEQAAQHYASVQPSLDDFTDLPLVAVLLRGLTWLPYWWSFAVFTAIGVSVAAAALVAWMRECGWRGVASWVLAAMCAWPVLLGFFSGQFDALLLAGTVGSLLLMRRNRPWAAGACMAVVLFKPHLLWPLPLLLFAAWTPAWPRAWRFLLSATAVVVGGAAGGFLLVPGSVQFFGHALGFGSRVGTVQPDLAGLPGLLLTLPGGALAGGVVAVAGAAAVLSLAVLSARHPRLRTLAPEQRAVIPLAGLAIWLACAPYAHPNDDVLLFPLLVLLIGAHGRRLTARALQVGVVASLSVAAAFIAGPGPGYALVAAGACLLVAMRERITPAAAAAVALVSLGLLPAVWPFHVLSVPITPLAVSAVALAGALHLRAAARASVDASVRQGQGGGRVLGVVVETAPGLATQAAGGHQPLQDADRGLVPGLVLSLHAVAADPEHRIQP